MTQEYLSEYKNYIEITTQLGCPNDCVYCPQSTLEKAYGETGNNIRKLILEEFKKILKNIPKNIQIDFGGMTEPFSNPQAADMIEYAHEQGYQIMLYTTLRGFSIEDIYRLKDIPFISCIVHTIDQDGLIKYSPDQQYFKKIRLLKELKYRNLDFMVIGRPREDVEKAIGRKLETTKILTRCGELNSEKFKNINQDLIETFQGDFKDNKKPLICGSLVQNRTRFRPTLAQRTLMLPNGDVVLCCMDYGLKHVLGNLKTKKYKQIINSKAMKDVEKAMLGKNDMQLLCRDCEWAVPYDKLRWILKKKIAKQRPKIPYAVCKYEYTYKDYNGANYGDTIQSIAARAMCNKAGIKNINELNRDTLSFYNGERVILIMNGCFYTFEDTNIFPLSDSIISFYFGFHATEEWGTRDFILKNKKSQKQFKKYEPLGCRDRGTALFLSKLGLKTYYSRCLTYTFSKREKEPENGKIFLVETPDELDKYIPEEYFKRIERLTHWPYPLPESPLSPEIALMYAKEAADILERYKNEANLVITRRFHCAVPCLAMGIPVIVIHDDPNNERMSSLSDFIKIYSYQEFDKIDWKPSPVDIETIKEEIELNFMLNLHNLQKKLKIDQVIQHPNMLRLRFLQILNWFKYKNKLKQLLFLFAKTRLVIITCKNKTLQICLLTVLPHILRIKLKLLNCIRLDISLGKYKEL